MKTVHLIGTYHEERGATNINELRALLKQIEPDVIFLEAPAEWSADLRLHEKTNSLESRAISLYRYELQVAIAAIPGTVYFIQVPNSSIE